MLNPQLPPEILDHIIDLLHAEPHTLRNCCLVTRSWIPRARKYLFGEIKIASLPDLHAWWKSFPDPGSSPAYHTHSLLLHSAKLISFVMEGCGWIRPFTNVMRLEMRGGKRDLRVGFLPYLLAGSQTHVA